MSILPILLYCLLFPSFCWLSAYFALLILGAWDESLDYWFEPWFWLYAFSALNSLLNTTLAISCKCGYVVFSFLLCSMCFLNFLWDFFDSLFMSVWFCLQVYEDGYLSVIDFEFGFIADGKYIISILLNSLRFTAHNMANFGICFVDAWKECVLYYRGIVVQMSTKFCWLVLLLNSSVSLLIFCLVALSAVDRGLMKVRTINVNVSTSVFNFNSSWVTYYADLYLVWICLVLVGFLGGLTLLSLYNASLSVW